MQLFLSPPSPSLPHLPSLPTLHFDKQLHVRRLEQQCKTWRFGVWCLGLWLVVGKRDCGGEFRGVGWSWVGAMAPSEQPTWKLRMLWEKKTPAAEAVRPASACATPVKRRPVYEHPFLHETLLREEVDAAAAAAANTSSLAAWKALLLTRRRLQLDPAKHLYFLCKHTSSSHLPLSSLMQCCASLSCVVLLSLSFCAEVCGPSPNVG